MLLLKYLLMASGTGMMTVAAGILGYDLYLENNYRRALETAAPLPKVPMRWRTGLALAMLAWAPMVLALSIVVLPRA